MRSRRFGIGLAFAAIYLIWGSTFFAIHIAVKDVQPLFLAGNRFVVAGIAVIAWSAWKGVSLRHVGWREAVIPGLLFFAIANGALSWAEARGLPSGTAAMLIASEPLWVAILQRLLIPGEAPLSWAQRLGLGIGFVGTVVLVQGMPVGVSLSAAVAVVVGAMAWALGSVLVMRWGRRARFTEPRAPKVDSVALAGLQMLIGGVACLGAAVALGEPVPRVADISGGALGAFMYLVVFGSIIAFLAYSFLLRTVSGAKVATYAYVNPVVAVLLGALIGEPVSGGAVVAMTMVVASVILTAAPRRRRAVPRLPRVAGVVSRPPVMR